MGYYRHYRKPYFHKRRYYRNYNNYSSKSKGELYVGIVFLMIWSLMFTGLSKYFGSIIFLILVISFIVFLAYKVINKKSSVPHESKTWNWRYRATESSKPQAYSVDKNQSAIINSEKHGCKCYMEGLNDGEREIAHILAEGLNYKDYFIFNNITIPSLRNGSSQIDHLVVSKFGIFVIETKNYGGWIFGSKDDENWTQQFPRGKTDTFQNPIRQNYSHKMALVELMPSIPKESFTDIVVFSGSAEFKKESIENVVYSYNLIECISKYIGIRLSESDIQLVIGKLSYLCQTADISPIKHIDNLNLSHPQNNLP